MDYKKPLNKVKFHSYYKIPGVREICTFVEYAAEKTTLVLTDWLLCTDVKHAMIKAKIGHNINSKKHAGKLVSKITRVMISLVMLMFLVIIILMPIIIFADASIKNQVYELTSGSINMDLYVDSNRKLLNLFHTDLLLENRKLSPVEKYKLGQLQNVGKLNMDLMRTFSFGSFSQKYLQLEVDGK